MHHASGWSEKRKKGKTKKSEKNLHEIASHVAATLYLRVIFSEDLHGNPADHSVQTKSRNYLLSSAT